MFSRFFAVGLVATFAALAGCAADDGAASSEKTGTDNADYTLRAPVVLGAIQPGETKKGYLYVPPQKRAWTFSAHAGDTVTATVTSQVGDAFVWITDANFNVLAYNDDEAQGTRDAQVTFTVPPSASMAAIKLAIVFADYQQLAAPFDTTLEISTGGSCSYNGQVYSPGEDFPSRDGCNTCTCESGGISCGQAVCACNPNNEPNKTYYGTPRECATIHPPCHAHQVPFSNECGCGCMNVP